eukprot:Awhi_evm1s13901
MVARKNHDKEIEKLSRNSEPIQWVFDHLRGTGGGRVSSSTSSSSSFSFFSSSSSSQPTECATCDSD